MPIDSPTLRDRPTRPEQLLVTSGALGAVALAARLLGPGDRVVADGPTYPGALEALRAHGGRVACVPLLDDGWDLDAVAGAYRQAVPRLGYVVVDFHNPTGLLLDGPGREALVLAAARCGVTLLVDETLVDLALDGPPVPAPVAAHDEDGRVLTVGSFSKSHWGGLRLGWLRGPAEVVARLAEARSAVDLAPPVLEQLVGLELLADEQALPRRVAQVRQRRDVLLAALAERLPDWQVRRPGGGLSLWARLPAPTATALCAAAERQGVRLVPGGRFLSDGLAERYVRLPFTLPPDDLRDAVDRLALAAQDLRPPVGRGAARVAVA